MQNLTHYMDPFFGNGTIDLPEPEGLAATWFFIKAQTGNTHPGAQAPLSMISAGPYTGGYPTGYGVNAPNTHATPPQYLDRPAAMGFAHLQQSGTGAIETYYNYFLVTPCALHEPSDGLGWLGTRWPLEYEQASPGYYAASLADATGSGAGIHAELTATPAVAWHRYTFSTGETAQLAVDFANGGIDFAGRRTRPSAREVTLVAPNAAQGKVVMEGVCLYVYLECTLGGGAIWYDTERAGGCSSLTLGQNRTQPGTSFGVVFSGASPTTVVLRLSLSLHSVEQARARVEEERDRSFDRVARATQAAWNQYANHIQVEGGTEEAKEILYSSLYHSLVKPGKWPDEGPWWSAAGAADQPFYVDFATMWDQYKTQLPLLLSLYPERGTEIVNSLLTQAEHLGRFPSGFVLNTDMTHFDNQARSLAQMTIADAYYRWRSDNTWRTAVDWRRALNVMLADLGQAHHSAFFEKSRVYPVTHTLDLAQACFCAAQLARGLGQDKLYRNLMAHSARWRGAYDGSTGRLIHTRCRQGQQEAVKYYEGGLWNYSFRLLHNMAGRIALYPSEAAYLGDLHRFFGYDQPAVEQPTVPGDREAMARGHALNRFEGYNNEPDIETPYAYLYAGRHDRCAEVVRAGMRFMYTTGRGGLPGNNDSGGLTSCYVWNAVGLFPVAGQPVYLIGSPIFDAASLLLGEKRFTIETAHNSPENLYVQRATLNGEPIDRAYLSVDEVHAGGTLRLEMGDTPSDWARNSRPPSYPGE